MQPRLPQSPTVRLSYDKAENLLSVKLRITHERQQKRFAFPLAGGVLVTKEDYAKLLLYHTQRSNRAASDIKNLHAELLPYLQRAELLCQQLHPFSFAEFKTRFYRAGSVDEVKPKAATGLLADLFKLEKEHSDAGQISYAEEFKNAAVSLLRFLNSREPDATELPYERVTKEFLMQYENWMLTAGKIHRGKNAQTKPAEGNSITTVGIYLRVVRKTFLWAISEKRVSGDNYPFGKKKYIIPTGRNIKKALTKNDVKKVMAFRVEPGTMQERSRDLWVFSYLSNGMNLTDICNLQWKHIDLKENTLEFVREKTARTGGGEQQKVSAMLFEESIAIIQRYQRPGGHNAYVFPFLAPGLSAQEKKRIVKQLVKVTNKYIRAIAKEIGISADVTTYTARHSFGTILLREGVPIEFISKKYAHRTIKTTESYMGDFEPEQEKDYLSRLV